MDGGGSSSSNLSMIWNSALLVSLGLGICSPDLEMLQTGVNGTCGRRGLKLDGVQGLGVICLLACGGGGDGCSGSKNITKVQWAGLQAWGLSNFGCKIAEEKPGLLETASVGSAAGVFALYVVKACGHLIGSITFREIDLIWGRPFPLGYIPLDIKCSFGRIALTLIIGLAYWAVNYKFTAKLVGVKVTFTEMEKSDAAALPGWLYGLEGYLLLGKWSWVRLTMLPSLAPLRQSLTCLYLLVVVVVVVVVAVTWTVKYICRLAIKLCHRDAGSTVGKMCAAKERPGKCVLQISVWQSIGKCELQIRFGSSGIMCAENELRKMCAV